MEYKYINTGVRTAIPAVPAQAAVPATATHEAVPAVPAIPGLPAITQQMVDDAKAIKKAYDDWIVEDDRILGAINIKCSATIQQINNETISARQLWADLESQYGITTSAGIFNDF